MGSWTINGTSFVVVRGNLAEQDVDAVAIGVGEDVLPDGPAGGAVFGAAGDELRQYLGEGKAVEAGAVQSVPGFDLPAERMYLCSMRPHGEVETPEAFLRSCVRNVLERADQEEVRSLSLAPLGLGDFGYPIDVVSRTAISTVRAFLGTGPALEEVRLVVYDVVEYSSVDNFAVEILEGPSTEKGKGNRPNLQF